MILGTALTPIPDTLQTDQILVFENQQHAAYTVYQVDPLPRTIYREP
jgi:hypothetical protein